MAWGKTATPGTSAGTSGRAVMKRDRCGAVGAQAGGPVPDGGAVILRRRRPDGYKLYVSDTFTRRGRIGRAMKYG
jgi:hypothetical protein